jgi:hypothetical protein
MPDLKLLAAGAGLVLACLALYAVVKSRRREGPMLTQGEGLPPLKGSLDANARGRGVSVELAEEIIDLLDAGRRAEAVAVVRERTGWDAQRAEKMLAWAEDFRKRIS